VRRPGPGQAPDLRQAPCLAHAAEIATDHHLCREHAAGILGAVMARSRSFSESAIDDLTRLPRCHCAHRHRACAGLTARTSRPRCSIFGSTRPTGVAMPGVRGCIQIRAARRFPTGACSRFRLFA
jgi:hypothetical protein